MVARTRTFCGSGPCCGDPCSIGSDAFDGALTKWTTIAGTPSTSGGNLELAEGDFLVFTPQPSSEGDAIIIETQPLSTDGTATVRLVCAFDDVDNYLFGEFSKHSGEGSLRLGRRANGNEVWLTEPVIVEDTGEELDERFTLRMCWLPGEIEEEYESFQLRYPTFAASTLGGWQTPENVFIEDGNFAQWLGSFNPGDFTEVLGISGFNFDLDPGSIPTGYTVLVKHADLGDGADYVIDFSVRLIKQDGTETGDNKATGLLIGGTSIQLGAYGDDTDDWNADLESEDINSPYFGLALIYRNTGEDSSTTVVVDEVTIGVFFTVPERREGLLRLSRRNFGEPNEVECVFTTRAVSLAGKQTGIKAQAGSWNASDYSLKYHNSGAKPTCPTCGCEVELVFCRCCAITHLPASQYIVDLGDGGWVNEDCEDCNDIRGEYVVTTVSSSGIGCEWFYKDPEICHTMHVHLYLREGPDGCYWRAGVDWLYSIAAIHKVTFAIYHSDPIASDEDCQTMPVTLNKVEEVTGEGKTCAGTMPDAITLKAVPP